jgi:hypothetical protein
VEDLRGLHEYLALTVKAIDARSDLRPHGFGQVKGRADGAV